MQDDAAHAQLAQQLDRRGGRETRATSSISAERERRVEARAPVDHLREPVGRPQQVAAVVLGPVRGQVELGRRDRGERDRGRGRGRLGLVVDGIERKPAALDQRRRARARRRAPAAAAARAAARAPALRASAAARPRRPPPASSASPSDEKVTSRPGTRIPSHAGSTLVGDPVGPQPAVLDLEAEREDRDARPPRARARPAARAESTPATSPATASASVTSPGNSVFSGIVLEALAQLRGRPAPDRVLVRGDEEDLRRAGEVLDRLGRADDVGVVGLRRAGRAGSARPPSRRRAAAPASVATTSGRGERRAAAAQPDDRRDQPQAGEQVGERQPEREAERDLPRRDREAGDDPPRAPQPVAAQAERQRERDARRWRSMCRWPSCSRRSGANANAAPATAAPTGPEPELAAEQVGAREGERVGEEEEQVVARRPRPRAPSRSGPRARSRPARPRTRACRRAARTGSPGRSRAAGS